MSHGFYTPAFFKVIILNFSYIICILHTFMKQLKTNCGKLLIRCTVSHLQYLENNLQVFRKKFYFKMINLISSFLSNTVKQSNVVK